MLSVIELWRNEKDFFGHPWPRNDEKKQDIADIDMQNQENLFLPRLSIKLDNFQFYHTASTSDNVDAKYIHRPKFEHKLKNWLTEQSGHGVYLITGHRGTGKSSLVGAVVNELKGEKEKREYIDICVNIGQDNIDELHILHIVAREMQDKLGDNKVKRIFFYIRRNRWLLRFVVLAAFIFDINRYSIVSEMTFCPIQLEGWVNIIAGVCIIMLLVSRLLWLFCAQFKVITRLNYICKRLYSSVVNIESKSVGMERYFWHKHQREYVTPPISIQEIEYDLTEMMKCLGKCSFIIVFDELDKVDPQEEYKEKGNGQVVLSEARRRKVLDMIANMKYFLSTAKAYFVFIAGPELYEAAMADISDREFAIGNLFNGVLSMDSFYTKGGLSDAIVLAEEFVCRQIMKPLKQQSERLAGLNTLKSYLQPYSGIRPQEEYVVFLYHFICYLAFISHGSPKKIAVFFEKYVRSYEYLKDQKQTYGINKRSKNTDWYLTFSDHQQLKINFVHYLTFPILQNIMNRSAIFGDKLRLAESFIFTHIVKLHNGGFSWRNIEQIPEIMAVNRAPEVREYIQSILMSMQQTIIKPVVCGLYAYKFPLRMAEEISYFSKLSDELSALLNFTLGELQPVKEHYYALLNKLPTDVEREGQSGILHRCAHIYAEASIRHALGDIYMQEENFSAAIRQFERCVELVTPLLIQPTVEEQRQLQNYVLFYYRTMLKLGLAHEKRHTDNSAYAVYGDLLRVLFEVKDNYPKFVAPLFRDNRGLHLGILAQLYVLERMGTTGITCNHIAEAIKRMGALYCFRLGGKRVAVCNPIVRADFCRKLGDVMFYKNLKCDECGNPAIRAYEKGIKVLLAEKGLEGRDFWQKIYGYIVSQRRTMGKSCRRDKIWLHSLAILFESLGHAYVGESKLWDLKSQSVRIVWSSGNIRFKIGVVRAHRLRKGKSRLQVGTEGAFPKGLYCYWVAAHLYDVACESQAVGRSYKHLLSAMEIYIKHRYRCKQISQSRELETVLRMANYITKRVIMRMYESYEHINMLEKNWFDDKLTPAQSGGSKEGVTGKIDNVLQCLSINEDMGEIAYAYSRLLIEYCYIDMFPGIEKIWAELFQKYRQVIGGRFASGTTLTTLVNSHRFILNVYKLYLSILFERKGSLSTLGAPSDIKDKEVNDFIEHGAKGMSDFKKAIGDKSNSEIEAFIKNIGGQCNWGTMRYGEADSKSQRLMLLTAILADGARRADAILKMMLGPLQVTTLFNHTFQGNVYGDYAIFMKLYNQLKAYVDEERIKEWKDVLGETQANPQQKLQYANEQYLAERALQSYLKVQECHGQGQAYQDLIQQLYLLEDDFSNDTIQFHLAVERIGLQSVKDRVRKLREDKAYNNSAYYLLASYNTPIEGGRVVGVDPCVSAEGVR